MFESYIAATGRLFPGGMRELRQAKFPVSSWGSTACSARARSRDGLRSSARGRVIDELAIFGLRNARLITGPIVRIPHTPALFLRLCRDFTLLESLSTARGDYWPETLDEWSAYLKQWRATTWQ